MLNLKLEDHNSYEDLVTRALTHIRHGLSFYQTLEEKTKFLQVALLDKKQDWLQKSCDLCSQVLNGDLEWEKHRKTKKHMHNAKMKHKKESGLSDREYYE